LTTPLHHTKPAPYAGFLINKKGRARQVFPIVNQTNKNFLRGYAVSSQSNRPAKSQKIAFSPGVF
jgi:hypothetical protein